ncbi:hypothetical protein PR202_ga24332 [Eleusine coracana subsp. coracana]|uniref:NAC domain-containing protein n=1 Tax=Eleusine coracana subsp. coracana TaxID=191504 RepID=A0AAV5D823_ELECO|nr:hypothetical protein QOZ80_1BG0048700 [Eleusine coracana subsp. coracana]GJN06588.1 hypothetical protein PR202_ga24332 [Eleusine coracana subsp. coracana]
MEGYQQLLPGFRFQPTDQEMIVCYLKNKMAGTDTSVTSIIANVDIYKFDPWELPGKAIVSGDGEWFFFSPRERKYPNGGCPNRTAGSGYWKATGTDKPIILAGGGGSQSHECVGVKKALVFYKGRSPKGTKTEWVMNEYRLLVLDDIICRRSKHEDSMKLDDWVLCRVRNKHHQQQLSFVAMDETSSSPVVHHHHHHPEEIMAAPPPPVNNYYNDHDDQTTGVVSSVLMEDSIKRKLSIDELHLLQHQHQHQHQLQLQLQPSSNKQRANHMTMIRDDDHIHMSPTSFSISDTDELF